MSEHKTEREAAAFWRNDALENAALIVERYHADPWIARDIRAMKSAAIPQAVSAEPSELDAKDAARYRWLRDCGKYAPASLGNGWGLVYGTHRYLPETLDEAVDAAMKKEQP